MKRFAVILLVFVMIFSMAYAESIDLTGMSDEELLALSDSLDLELVDRNLRPILSVGDYVGGKDIGVGKYVVYEHSEDHHSQAWYICVYKSETARADYQKAYADYQVARQKANDNKAAGKDYEYPAEVVFSDYGIRTTIESGDTFAFSIKEGEMLSVGKGYADENAFLSISKSEGLFMN